MVGSRGVSHPLFLIIQLVFQSKRHEAPGIPKNSLIIIIPHIIQHRHFIHEDLNISFRPKKNRVMKKSMANIFPTLPPYVKYL